MGKINGSLFSSESVEYRTPKVLYDFFINDLGAVDLFPFKRPIGFDQYEHFYNHKVLFCNPPFKDMNRVAAYLRELYLYHFCEIWLLCPVRTDTKWFFQLTQFMNEIYFFTHRLKFNDLNTVAPFPCCLIHISRECKNNYTHHFFSVDSFISQMKGLF